MIGLDTNVLLRWLVTSAASEKERKAIRDAISGEDAVHISAVALAETIWLLTYTYRQSKTAIKGLMMGLLESENVHLESREQLWLALAEQETYGGDLTDHILANHDQQAGCRYTLTFDRKAARSPKFVRLEAN